MVWTGPELGDADFEGTCAPVTSPCPRLSTSVWLQRHGEQLCMCGHGCHVASCLRTSTLIVSLRGRVTKAAAVLVPQSAQTMDFNPQLQNNLGNYQAKSNIKPGRVDCCRHNRTDKRIGRKTPFEDVAGASKMKEIKASRNKRLLWESSLLPC